MPRHNTGHTYWLARLSSARWELERAESDLAKIKSALSERESDRIRRGGERYVGPCATEPHLAQVRVREARTRVAVAEFDVRVLGLVP